ncbi:FtsX-like permease family protein [Streptomyces sp. M19]
MTALLASRAARTHRKAWAAVIAALVLTSLLLGTFGLTLASAGLGHARVERYAAADLVVAGDQNTRFTTTSWPDGRQTARTALTARVRVPAAALDTVRRVPGVRTAVADEEFEVGVGRETVTGRPWPAAQLAPYALRRAAPHGRRTRSWWARERRRPRPRRPRRPPTRTPAWETASSSAWPGPAPATPSSASPTAPRRRLPHRRRGPPAGRAPRHRGRHRGYRRARRTDRRAPRARTARPGHRRCAERRAAGGRRCRALRVLTGDGRGAAEFLAAAPARTDLLALLGALGAVVVLVALLVVSSTVGQALGQRAHELGLLRAVGATPRQVRAAVGREVARVAALAAAAGAVAAVPAYLGLRALLSATGALPAGLVLPFPAWLVAARSPPRRSPSSSRAWRR